MDSQLPNKNGFLINDLTIICKCEITISNYDNEGEEPTIRPRAGRGRQGTNLRMV